MARTDRITMRNQWKNSASPKARKPWDEYRRERKKKEREAIEAAKAELVKANKLRAKRLRDAELKRQKRAAAKAVRS